MGEPVQLMAIRDVLERHGDLDRVRVVGRVVGKFLNEEGSFGSITLDDETGTLRAKFFSDSIDRLGKVEWGDFVEVYGRVREFQEEVHVVADAVGVFRDVNWELLRKLQLLKGKDRAKEVLAAIKGGRGSMEELTAEFGEQVVEEVRQLMERGEIYEKEPKKYAPVE